jgi:hypothetical protein
LWFEILARAVTVAEGHKILLVNLSACGPLSFQWATTGVLGRRTFIKHVALLGSKDLASEDTRYSHLQTIAESIHPKMHQHLLVSTLLKRKKRSFATFFPIMV